MAVPSSLQEQLPSGLRTVDEALHRTRFRILPFLGPAFIACVAYIDPGNFATNIAAGSKFGYLLVWVVIASSLMAMVIQTLSAKLGIATDLAEFLGAAIGFNLLLGTSLAVSTVLTGIVAFALLSLQSYGFRPFEAVIATIVGVIGLCYVIELIYARPDLAAAGEHVLRPQFAGTESVLLAVGILGATVMPHVIYLHSALRQHRLVGATEKTKQRIARFERVDVVIAMSLAGIVNMSMLITAAAVFHTRGLTEIGDDLGAVHDALGHYLGGSAGALFGIALLASGLSSSSVGTLAGQVVMQGFVNRKIPLFLRRFVTMVPALVVIAIGVDPSRALVISQVVLSFGIPFALIPLLLFCRDRSLMGELVNRRSTTIAAWIVAGAIISLNVFLLE